MKTTTHDIDTLALLPESRLRHGRVLTLLRAAGTLIVCRSGRLWVTEEGIAADFVLAAGQTYAVAGSGKVVVEAIVGDALVAVRLPAAAAVNDPAFARV